MALKCPFWKVAKTKNKTSTKAPYPMFGKKGKPLEYILQE
jgi:hypothetical protein